MELKFNDAFKNKLPAIRLVVAEERRVNPELKKIDASILFSRYNYWPIEDIYDRYDALVEGKITEVPIPTWSEDDDEDEE